MTSIEDIESHLIKLEVPYESIGNGAWVVHPDDARRAHIGVQLQEPIVLFSMPLFELRAETPDRESLFRKLLELNSELLHSSYGLDGEKVVLSGAHQLANLDSNEFQAMIDDMTMALDNHYEALSSWAAPAQEGNA